ncbi:Hydantoinase B/oxoprolinase-domain-containing protein [Clohesyomyces aquaticus]|uniref:Hydantoinase B/oxoprolinase-domain-containing protein n=1 Tax=Clohesyomyces aquaticus TaxID=1231657 RepID=A0A1Y1ZJ04_9PLEO|nr:Hydantoinase B/oxoprolinase-domain-containing protein [Clohesyomyces aquaticus]
MASPQPSQRGIRIAIDRGGTFTDCVGNPGSGKMEDDVLIKLLSVDPSNYEDAPLEGIRRLLSKFTGQEIPRGEPLDTSKIESIRMGTTVATNALLERKGEDIAMVVTKGFKDCLAIGNQSRPNIFALDIRKPEVLYKKVVEIDERVTLEDYAEDPERTQTKAEAIDKAGSDAELVRGLSGETVRILRRPEEEAIRGQLQEVYDSGLKSIAVCLMHGYTYPNHEALVGKIAKEIGFEHVSLSSELMPMIKLVPRATSACADAYLTPAIRKYIDGFSKGFEGGLGTKSVKREEGSKGARCEFMQSDGGLVDVDIFSGLKAILSGPAGGVVGYALTSYDPQTKIPVIGFDMGGTSTDVSRYGSGRYDHVFETTTAGVTIQSPQLDINTVAAGGGSRLFWKNGLFVVGPESAGAHPGPACYRKGGPLTITDANLFLGRLLPDFFPKIFGKNENEGLDAEASEKLFKELAEQINKEVAGDNKGKEMSLDEVAHGFIKIANETMTRPIRSLTEARGHDTSKHRLATFGGAGGQHAVAIAEALGISQILIHRYSSVLSAYGMALADVVDERQEPESKVWSDEKDVREYLQQKMEELKCKSTATLKDQGFTEEQIHFEEYLNLRYRGTESALMIIKPTKEEAEKDYGGDEWAFGKAFVKQHEQEFGFTLPDRDIIVDDVRARGIGKTFQGLEKTVDQQLKEIKPRDLLKGEKEYATRQVYFEGGRQDTSIYKLEDLAVGDRIKGPAIIADGTQTIVVTPGASALVINTHVIINIGDSDGQDKQISTKEVDPILLSIFAHRFMAIAEQMGRALQKTSVSTNVKERLDYSCALFDSEGGLVANAPHLPVHLGSMSTCVRKQASLWSDKLKRGDVLVSNHPMFGGTHLPDITVITPAFSSSDKIIFYVASRAHHADIGGILPGSMPPHSRELFQEGAAIKSEKLVSEGHFNETRITELLLDEPGQYPGCSGTRCLSDNINDLKAQVAANQKGINLISTLMSDYGEAVVRFYMTSIQANAEQSVRALLKDMHKRFEGQDLSAEDFMDDGSPIRLRVTIDPEKGEAVFDFSGTGPEVYGNINAPEAVTYSAIIYCLRCLISEDIPLNQGCLAPIHVRIPKKSFLSPSDNAAVVGGNVLTSQRVTDVVLKAFKACAASQGDTNNLTFGFGGTTYSDSSSDSSTNHRERKETKGFGYYETIAGGSGAGPTWHGTSGVHTHMTNTRITDSEVFERRYPVLLREFGLRPNSKGLGMHDGGEGVIRDIEFRIPVQVSILSERRVYHPYGMNGGGDAQCGLNIWVRKVNKKTVNSDSDSKIEGDVKEGAKTSGEVEDLVKRVVENKDEVEYRYINLGAKNTASMWPGERIIIHTPGGGGWGKPGEESKAVEKMDPRSGWRQGSVASRQMTAEASA